MTFRQFEIFLAVARARSFTRAAGALHLSQSTLSVHVRELERELGARLFDRLGRTVVLTEAGRLLEEHARRIAASLASARQTIQELQGLQSGSLVIGASTTPGIYVLPGIVATFRERHPAVDVSLRIANSRVIEERIRADDVDLGVVGGHVLGPTQSCVAAGLIDELVLVVPPGHASAGRREISPRELASSRLLMREEGSATRQVTERTLRQAGVKFTTGMELDHVEAVKQAVIAGLGVAFVSIHAIRGELATHRLYAVRLKGLRIRRHFHIIRNAARAPSVSAAAFLELLAGSSRPARGNAASTRRSRGSTKAVGPS
jgi:DNA-binding transcriptional LysR family regulator